MAIVNHAKREINAKIVYYGPEDAGKSTSLRYVYDRIKPSLRGELKTLPSGGSSLFFFDFSPFEQPVFAGYHLRLHVYTLQGRVANPAAWKMTLKGADGLVIVADATLAGRPALRESVVRLREYLGNYGLALDVVPFALQLNKADLAGPVVASEVASELGLDGQFACLTMAVRGEGVLDILAGLSRQIMDRIREREDLPQEKGPDVDASAGNSPEALQLQPAAAIMEDGGSANAIDTALCEPAANDAVPTGHLTCGGVVVLGDICVEDGIVRIPLDVSHPGGKQRLVVTVAIAPAPAAAVAV